MIEGFKELFLNISLDWNIDYFYLERLFCIVNNKSILVFCSYLLWYKFVNENLIYLKYKII